MRELGQLGVMAKQHRALHVIAKLMDHVEQIVHLGRVQPLGHDDILALVVELLSNHRCRAKCAHGGLDRIKSGFTSRFANRAPIFGASRRPRSFNGRSLSGNAASSQLDLAWRMRRAFDAESRTLRQRRPPCTGPSLRVSQPGDFLPTATRNPTRRRTPCWRAPASRSVTWRSSRLSMKTSTIFDGRPWIATRWKA